MLTLRLGEDDARIACAGMLVTHTPTAGGRCVLCILKREEGVGVWLAKRLYRPPRMDVTEGYTLFPDRRRDV